MSAVTALAYVGLPSALVLGLSLGWLYGDSHAPARVEGEIGRQRDLIADLNYGMHRQALELIAARREARDWQRRTLIAENKLPVQAVKEIYAQEQAQQRNRAEP